METADHHPEGCSLLWFGIASRTSQPAQRRNIVLASAQLLNLMRPISRFKFIVLQDDSTAAANTVPLTFTPAEYSGRSRPKTWVPAEIQAQLLKVCFRRSNRGLLDPIQEADNHRGIPGWISQQVPRRYGKWNEAPNDASGWMWSTTQGFAKEDKGEAAHSF